MAFHGKSPPGMNEVVTGGKGTVSQTTGDSGDHAESTYLGQSFEDSRSDIANGVSSFTQGRKTG